jgi:hypothetical protein
MKVATTLKSEHATTSEPMARSLFILIALCSLSVAQVADQAQEKPRVYVSGKGTQNTSTNASASGNRWFVTGHAESTSDAHDEGMEVTKDLQKECPRITVTFNQSTADYTLMLDRESKQKRGLLRTNSQVEVINRAGDVIGSNSTRTVNSASKDACDVMLSDWAQHGRIAAPVPPVQAEKPPSQAVPISAAAVQADVSEHKAESYTTVQAVATGMGSATDTT